ncbi:MAG: hypothetical protein WBE26_19075 [Phycisphaerae bacterium]
MRKVTAVLTAAVLSVGLTGVREAQATDSVRPTKRSPISFRLAATTAVRSYEEMTVGRSETVYVAPQAALSGDEVAFAEAMDSSKGNAIDMALADGVAGRLAAMMKKHGADRLAVFVGDKLVATGSLKVDAAGNRAVLSGVPSVHADRLIRVLNGLAPTGPTVTVVPSQSNVQPGEAVKVDAFVNGVSDLRVYQMGLSVTGGTKGRLVMEDAVIATRGDHVFGTAKKIDAVDKTSGLMGAMLFDSSVEVVKPAYLGTYMLRASADAAGTFDVNVHMDHSSFLRDSKNWSIGFYPGPAATITVGTPSRLQRTDK